MAREGEGDHDGLAMRGHPTLDPSTLLQGERPLYPEGGRWIPVDSYRG